MQVELSVFYARLGSIALIMVLGFLLGKFKLISEHTNKQITNLLLTVFMPASLFMAFPSEYDQASANLFFSGLLAGAIVMLLLIILAKIIFNKKWMKKELSHESQFAMIFNNATFLGYPIVANTFGPSGILAYCGFIISFNIALFSYGIWLFEQKVSVKLLFNIIFNPNIIAVVLGMVLFLIGFKLPNFFTDAVGYVGGATTPLSTSSLRKRSGSPLSTRPGTRSSSTSFRKWAASTPSLSFPPEWEPAATRCSCLRRTRCT